MDDARLMASFGIRIFSANARNDDPVALLGGLGHWLSLESRRRGRCKISSPALSPGFR